MVYTKEFLLDAYVWRFEECATDIQLANLMSNAERLYDKVGRDKFRTYARLTPEYLRLFKLSENSFLKLSSEHGTVLLGAE